MKLDLSAYAMQLAKRAPLQKAVRKTLPETWSSLQSIGCFLETGLGLGFSTVISTTDGNS